MGSGASSVGSHDIMESNKSKTDSILIEKKTLFERHITEKGGLQNMTESDINELLLNYRDTKLELSLAREVDFIGFLAQHNFPPFQMIPYQVYELKDLIELNFSHNQLEKIDEKICELKQLKKLDLSNNRLNELPENLSKLINLNSLLISENLLISLPLELGNCNKLQKLICFKNQLNTLPDSISNCIELEEINLFNNKLINLGNGFYKLKNLMELNIAGNLLIELNSFDNFIHLKRIAAYQNKLKQFPSLIYCKELTQLQIYRNALKELPDMTNLIELAELDANSNQIRQLPESICVLNSKLRNINLRKNRFLNIPSYIGNLKKLEILNMGNNPISSPLPDEIGSLTSLVSFLLDDSNLTILPPILITMNNLVRVDVGSRIDQNDTTTQDVINKLEIICKMNKGWLKQS